MPDTGTSETPVVRWGSPTLRGGRFTHDEADDYIRRLQEAESDPAKPVEAQGLRHSAQGELLGRMPAEQLAAEFHHRGWMTIEPLTPSAGAAQDPEFAPDPTK